MRKNQVLGTIIIVISLLCLLFLFSGGIQTIETNTHQQVEKLFETVEKK